ncbi:adenylyltransferase/cytidyltransferase family protein [Actinomycetospora sp. CA-101289]|uniref:adenylyltransferase/cytidyltransferase family protein n=1 Tax=Actinomycetospora sp. CA-101289 TaxID=3239893 RepID=UPI003D95259B
MQRAPVFWDLEELLAQIGAWRCDGRTLGLVSGTFDLLHVGHMRFLERASCLTDALIVGVDSDAKVSVRKGAARPVLPDRERMEMLSHVRHVDAVFLKTIAPRWHFATSIQPDVLIVSSETYGEEDLDLLRQEVKAIALLPRDSGMSTSQPSRLMAWRK